MKAILAKLRQKRRWQIKNGVFSKEEFAYASKGKLGK